jgi:signal peptidase I
MKPKRILKESRRRLARKGHLLGEDDRKKIERLVEELQDAILVKSRAQAKKSASALRKKVIETMPKRFHEIVIEYIVSFGLAIIIALLIRHFIIEPFKIPTGSMIPTFVPGDYILVSKARYGPRIPFTDIRPFGSWKPQRWDIVVFTTKGIDKASQYPRNFVKRVVGLPGEEIEIRDGDIYVNGEIVEKTEWMKNEKVPFAVIQRNRDAERDDVYVLRDPPNQSSDRPAEHYEDLPQKAEIRDGKICVGEKEVYIGRDPQSVPFSIGEDGKTVFIDGVYYFNTLETQSCPIEAWKYRINFLDFHFWRIPGTQDVIDKSPPVCGFANTPFKVPDGHYLVMGDNSPRSYDSRGWGFVPYENIKGKVLLRWWPPKRWGVPR